MVYVDPRNIVEVIEQQNLKIREQEAQIAALQAEVDWLRKLAPWSKNPRVRIKILEHDAGREGHIVKVWHDETMVMLDGSLVYKWIQNKYIEYITQEPASA
jgi:hypothetical protein